MIELKGISLCLAILFAKGETKILSSLSGLKYDFVVLSEIDFDISSLFLISLICTTFSLSFCTSCFNSLLESVKTAFSKRFSPSDKRMAIGELTLIYS